jgi:hypothetical protein
MENHKYITALLLFEKIIISVTMCVGIHSAHIPNVFSVYLYTVYTRVVPEVPDLTKKKKNILEKKSLYFST